MKTFMEFLSIAGIFALMFLALAVTGGCSSGPETQQQYQQRMYASRVLLALGGSAAALSTPPPGRFSSNRPTTTRCTKFGNSMTCTEH
jgi:hypothetical protein